MHIHGSLYILGWNEKALPGQIDLSYKKSSSECFLEDCARRTFYYQVLKSI